METQNCWIIHGSPAKRAVHERAALRILRVRYPFDRLYADEKVAHKLHLIFDGEVDVRSLPKGGKVEDNVTLVVGLWEVIPDSWDTAAFRKGIARVELL